MLTVIEKVMLLQDVDVFAEVPGDQLATLAAIAEEERVLTGDVLYREGEEADALYLVLEGDIRLSQGERQRVGVCRALATEPPLVLADEPTGNLDSASADVILSLLLELAENDGRTVLLTSHSESVAKRCGRRIRIEHGALVDDDYPKDA